MTKHQRASKRIAEQKIKTLFNLDECDYITPPPSTSSHHNVPACPRKKRRRIVPTSPKREFEFEKDIENLPDMIDVCRQYMSEIDEINPVPSLERLCNVFDSLVELNNMIGLEHVKKTIVDQLIFIVQGFMDEEEMMMHIRINGKPGMGKTCLAEILASIFAGIGILSIGDVITATRSDLIGSHLGETAIKTSAVFLASRGNVLLLDEVYSLGSHDRRDSFSKECIDTINHFLTELKNDMICIIAGYKEDIDECFFSINKGLERRFPWVYDIEDYTLTELVKVFEYQVKLISWELEKDVLDYLRSSVIIDSNKHLFNNFGGDTENFLGRCKISHAKRLFKHQTDLKTSKCKLSVDDIKMGFEHFKLLKSSSTASKNISSMLMYT